MNQGIKNFIFFCYIRRCSLFVTALLMVSFPKAQPTVVGYLPAGLNEISGITMSGNRGVFAWVHNDSGDTSRIFGIGKKGTLITTLYFEGIEKGRTVRDCEDIASGKGASGNERFLYLGDIGDNGARRSSITVYRAPEPATLKATMHITVSPVILQYPDGPRDAETLMIDNVDRLLYIVSKRDDTVAVYTVPLSWTKGDTITLQKRSSLFFPGFRPQKWVVSGDISWNGQQVLIKTLQKVYYWKRAAQEPIWKTLQRPPRELPYQLEKQGEAICFNTAADGYYTVSEGEKQPVNFYKLVLPGKP